MYKIYRRGSKTRSLIQTQSFEVSNFLENDFWTLPPILSILYMDPICYMDIIDHVAAALGQESVLT